MSSRLPYFSQNAEPFEEYPEKLFWKSRKTFWNIPTVEH